MRGKFPTGCERHPMDYEDANVRYEQWLAEREREERFHEVTDLELSEMRKDKAHD